VLTTNDLENNTVSSLARHAMAMIYLSYCCWSGCWY